MGSQTFRCGRRFLYKGQRPGRRRSARNGSGTLANRFGGDRNRLDPRQGTATGSGPASVEAATRPARRPARRPVAATRHRQRDAMHDAGSSGAPAPHRQHQRGNVQRATTQCGHAAALSRSRRALLDATPTVLLLSQRAPPRKPRTTACSDATRGNGRELCEHTPSRVGTVARARATCGSP